MMLTPSPAFAEHLTAVYQAYHTLVTAPMHPAAEHLALPPAGGVYIFYERGQPIYVGRTRHLRRRIQQHAHPASTHYSASFAFLMARRLADLPAVPRLTRTQLSEELDSLFSLCRQRVSYMSVRWVSIEDSVVQSLLEIYAAVTLQTTEHFNSFRTT